MTDTKDKQTDKQTDVCLCKFVCLYLRWSLTLTESHSDIGGEGRRACAVDVTLRKTQDATEGGRELGVTVRVQHRIDGRVGVAEQDGDSDQRQVGASGEERHAVHDVQRQPAQREHGQHHAEPLGRSDLLLPGQLPRRVSRRRLGRRLLLLLRSRVVHRSLICVSQQHSSTDRNKVVVFNTNTFIGVVLNTYMYVFNTKPNSPTGWSKKRIPITFLG